MLSATHRVYDIIEHTCPALLCPKLLLQKTWDLKIGWDTPLEGEIKQQFLDWYKDLYLLESIIIPRMTSAVACKEGLSIHCFCDASG